VLEDIVIDTNVFVHAGTPNAKEQASALAFLKAMHESKTNLCIDKPFDNLNEAKNQSIIGFEYIKHVRGNTYGYYVLASLAAAQRILVVGDSVAVGVAKKINQCIANRHDRIFLRVAVNSKSSEFASHDFDDFPPQKRQHIRKEIQVRIRTADEAKTLLG
jgi:hypothetical protein